MKRKTWRFEEIRFLNKRSIVSAFFCSYISIIRTQPTYGQVIFSDSALSSGMTHYSYPFGMMMPGRQFSNESYRYGFQGQETDDELKGEGYSVNYKYRMHDARIGMFFEMNPLGINLLGQLSTKIGTRVQERKEGSSETMKPIEPSPTV